MASTTVCKCSARCPHDMAFCCACGGRLRATEWPEPPRERSARRALRERYTIARESEYGGLMIVRRDGVKVGTTQTERAARLMRGRMIAQELS